MATDADQGLTADLSAILRQAVGLLAVDPARAETLARGVLRTTPDNTDASIILGTSLRARGDFESARGVFEPLAATQGGSWIVQFEWARTLVALGRSRAATGPLTRAVSLKPGLTAAWRMLGDILMLSGQVGAAQTAYDRRLRSMIGDPRLHGPADALADGRLNLAERDLRAILTRDPTVMAAAHLFGEVLSRQGRLADAKALLAECLVQAPGLDLARQSYALVLFAGREFPEALIQLDMLLARDPGDNRCRMIKAAALTEVGDYAGAADVTASLLREFPDQPQALLVYGNGLRTLGRIDDALDAYRKCIELEPDGTDAYWSLANLKTYRFTAEMLGAIEARLAAPDLKPADRGNLHFTLGKAREDAGRYAEAFGHYARGAAVERERRSYDPDRTTAHVRRSKDLFTPAFFADRAGWGAPAADPIFIVGLPRSGSTLVDQILASHPAVEGTRELPDLQMIADRVAGLSDGGRPGEYLEQLGALPRDAYAGFGRDYLDGTRSCRRLDRPHFIDKAPLNFLHLGLIHLILPRAKIIDVRRDPLGCCVSAFKQHFSQGFDFSYDLTDVGRYYVDYVDLMAHFDAVLPGRVHRVIYEQLVADTETEVRRLLAYLQLPFDPACLRFFENPRPVATPSSEQVRRPIYADAIDQWRHFEPWLGPLKAALSPVLSADSAAPPPFNPPDIRTARSSD